MEHPKRPKEFGFQLPITLGLDIFAVQPNFLVKNIAPRFNSFIVSSFLKFLGMLEVFLANNH